MFAGLATSLMRTPVLRGIRSRGESCANAAMLTDMPMTVAITPLEIARSFEFLHLK
jgi:hypothetical protein